MKSYDTAMELKHVRRLAIAFVLAIASKVLAQNPLSVAAPEEDNSNNAL